MSNTETSARLTAYLSPIGAWAFSLGTAIGWGSLVVTSNTYLVQAGPWGSVLGLLIGAAIMVVMAKNYHYLINRYPDCGGAYTYAKKVFGHDQAFLTAWFLALTYIAIFWANDTSLPLFARYFLGDSFQFGLSYSVFGYEVHAGEALLSIAGIAFAVLMCMRFKRLVAWIVVALALVFTVAIAACFVAVALGLPAGFGAIEPGFVPDKSAVSQTLLIACISPWAFIGFENISQQAEEFAFPARKAFRIMVASIAVATALYVLILLMSTTAFPEQYGSWFEYLSDLGNLQGIEGLPVFYAAYRYMGDAGIVLLMIALLGLVVTSLFGNMVALSRLLLAMAKDDILPTPFRAVNKHGIPGNTIALIGAISLFIPFLGRTAIGWIVDVTTIGATIVYGFVAAAALWTARKKGDEVERLTGIVGLVVMLFFGVCLLLPDFLFSHGLAPESYFLFTAWGILGFLAFRRILHQHPREGFGRSMIVWIGLLSLVVFFSFTWMSQSVVSTTNSTIATVQAHYVEKVFTGSSEGSPPDAVAPLSEQDVSDEGFVEQEMQLMEADIERSIFVAAVLFAAALALLLSNYSYMANWARTREEELDVVKDIALTDPLTHVKSRHAFRQMEEEMNARIATDSAEPFAIVVCDLNNLKDINDTLGHEMGDDYIKAASSLVCNTFDHSPVYRVGGDEFAVLLKGRNLEQRDELMASLREASEANATSGGAVVAVGVADYRKGEDLDTRSVFERADTRMYQNKHRLKDLFPDFHPADV